MKNRDILKRIITIILVTAVFFTLPLSVNAVTADEVIDKAGGDSDSEPPASLIQHGLSLIFSSLSQSGKGVLTHCMGILAVCLLSGILTAFQNSFPILGGAAEYISVLALSGVLFSAVVSVTEFAVTATLRFAEYLTAMLPVMTAMYVYGGSPAAAVASATGLNLFCTVITVICGGILMPLVKVCLILSLTSALPGCSSVQPITAGIKNLSASVTAFVFSLLGFAVSIQTVISAAGDSYASRTVRFASGIFIPVIGNMVGEASRTVMSAVGKAKASVGLVGIAAIFTLFVPPILVVVLYKMGILLCGSAAKMMGCEREARLLYDVNGIFGILLAVVLGSGLVGILAMTVFVCAGISV